MNTYIHEYTNTRCMTIHNTTHDDIRIYEYRGGWGAANNLIANPIPLTERVSNNDAYVMASICGEAMLTFPSTLANVPPNYIL